jgi:hypothetical protein
MSKNYIDNHDGTYTIEAPTTCCSRTTKADLTQTIANLTNQIAQLTARKIEVQADLDAINVLSS